MWVGIACAATALTVTRTWAEALLVIEAESGRVLYSQNAGQAWYPASVTKLMTAYVTLRAVKEGRLALDTPLTVSPNAVAQSPVKMGFGVGTVVTVDNALKMLMVKSANDTAVVLAEGVAGSIENFAGEMNANARHLGMIQSSFVNPNGLPADDQISSARDLAILARALIRELPEYDYYWHLPGIRMGKMVRWNYNTLIGRYPGADGMKTGFICASGFNLVASATRNGRRLIAVVLGASSGTARSVRAAQLLDRGFASNGLAWIRPSLGTVDQLKPIDASPPNLRDDVCSGKRHRPASDEDDAPIASIGNSGSASAAGDGANSNSMFLASSLQAPLPKPSEWLAAPPAPSEPIVVYTGPTRSGAALVAAVAADTASQDTPRKRSKRTHVAAKKPDAAEPKSTEAKGAKPVATRHASAKPDTGAKPAASEASAAKPKSASSKPAPKTAAKPKAKSDSKPAS